MRRHDSPLGSMRLRGEESADSGIWYGRENEVEARHPVRQRGQRAKSGASSSALAASWGLRPLPRGVCWAGRPGPGVAVTQPGSSLHPLHGLRAKPVARVRGWRGPGEHLSAGEGGAFWHHPGASGGDQSGSTTADSGGRQPLPGHRPGVPASLALGAAVGTPPRTAGPGRRSRAACSATPSFRRSPSASAAASPPRRPGSARGRRSCASPGAGCRSSLPVGPRVPWHSLGLDGTKLALVPPS